MHSAGHQKRKALRHALLLDPVSAIVGIGGSLISAGAAGDAADAQAESAANAQKLEWDMFNKNVELQEPWRQTGMGALRQLAIGTGNTGRASFDEDAYLRARPDAAEWIKAKKAAGEDYSAYDHYVLDGSRQGGFDATGQAGFNDFNRDFTAADFVKDPGYQFRMDEGQRGVEAGAAARGGALSGAAIKDVARFGQDYGTGEYGNAYNRFNADRDRRFGRLSQLAGIGQTATTQVANQGNQTAGRVGDLMTQAGNARASGYVGAANAVNQGLGTMANWYNGSRSGSGNNAWDAGGFSGSNDSSWASTGSPTDWFQKYGSSGD